MFYIYVDWMISVETACDTAHFNNKQNMWIGILFYDVCRLHLYSFMKYVRSVSSEKLANPYVTSGPFY